MCIVRITCNQCQIPYLCFNISTSAIREIKLKRMLAWIHVLCSALIKLHIIITWCKKCLVWAIYSKRKTHPYKVGDLDFLKKALIVDSVIFH